MVSIDCWVVDRNGSWPDLPSKILKHFTAREYRTLCAICDTFIPSFVEQDVERCAKKFLK